MRILQFPFLAAIISILAGCTEKRPNENVDASDEAITIAVVHGATFGEAASFGKGLVEFEGTFVVETEIGTSPPFTRMRYRGVPCYFVRGHLPEPPGVDHPPGWEKIKTWTALHQLGVTHIFGGDVCGSINKDYGFDDLVVVDDFILKDNQRPPSVLQAAGISRPGIFPDFQVPFCPDLRRLYIEDAKEAYHGRVYSTGVIVQDDPGRFETPAEIRYLRLIGGDLVSHNVVTEAVYARQLGMHFALLNSVSNPAVGVEPFTFGDMQKSVQRIARGTVPILLECIARMPKLKQTCGYGCTVESVEGSFTDPSAQTDENIY